MKIEVLEGFTAKPSRSGVFLMDKLLMALRKIGLYSENPYRTPAKEMYAGVWV